jgi:hypothetical protein
LAKDIEDFEFADTPLYETLVRDFAIGGFVADQRNAVLIGGTENGDVVFEATSNTTFTIKLKGSDGTVRSGMVALI